MLAEDDIISVGPERDNQGKRAIIIKFGKWKPSKITVEDIFKATLILIEIGSLEPIAQVRGAVAIFDMKGLGLNHIMQLSPAVAQKMLCLMVVRFEFFQNFQIFSKHIFRPQCHFAPPPYI